MENASGEVLSQIDQLFYLGQLQQAIRLAQTGAYNDAVAPAICLRLARCLHSQGRFPQAASVCDALLLDLSQSDVVAREAAMWRAITGIYLTGDTGPALSALRRILAADSREKHDVRLAAIANDLLARVLLTAIEWFQAPPSEQATALDLLAQAAKEFSKAGDMNAALDATLRLARVRLAGSRADRRAARTLLRKVRDRAERDGNLVRQASAVLILAEAALDDVFSQWATSPRSEVDPELYQQALVLYDRAGHALGPADAYLSWGQKFTKAGFDGTDPLNMAGEIYRQQANLTGCYATLSTLGLWYVRQGLLDKALKIYREIAEMSQEMGFVVGQASTLLALGDLYARGGDYARSLDAYRESAARPQPPVMRALSLVLIATTSTQMNLQDEAQAACQEAIVLLTAAKATQNLSLAYYVLGNILVARRDWAQAIATWEKGLELETLRGDKLAQAERLNSIAWATAMLHYNAQGPTVPEDVYEQANSLYGKAHALLEGASDGASLAVKASTYQLQAQTSLLYQRPAEAVDYLVRAYQLYAALEMGMQAAMTDAHLGLVYTDLGQRYQPDHYEEAIRYHERALSYFEGAGMWDMTWKFRYYLAYLAYRQGLLAPEAAARESCWRRALQRLQAASADIEFVRGRYVASDPVAAEAARLGLVSDKERVYELAILLCYLYLHDPTSAFSWLERLKGRVFLDTLALTPLTPWLGAEPHLLEHEVQLLTAIRDAPTQGAAIAFSTELRAIWDQMAGDPEAAEYVAIRRGEPAHWSVIREWLRNAVT